MSKRPAKHFPVPTPETAPYWEACRDHRLQVQECGDCGRFQFFPRVICSHCGSRNVKWVAAGGRGTVVSYTIMHRAVSRAYEGEGVTILALIRLEEGVQMMSNIVQCAPEDVATGMTVEVTFEDWSDEISVPMFRPAGS